MNSERVITGVTVRRSKSKIFSKLISASVTIFHCLNFLHYLKRGIFYKMHHFSIAILRNFQFLMDSPTVWVLYFFLLLFISLDTQPGFREDCSIFCISDLDTSIFIICERKKVCHVHIYKAFCRIDEMSFLHDPFDISYYIHLRYDRIQRI